VVDDQFLGLAPYHKEAHHDCKNVDDHEVSLTPYYWEAHLDPLLVQGILVEWGAHLVHCCPERLRILSPLTSIGTRGTLVSECQGGKGRKREYTKYLLKKLIAC
jgi:hypothetical protein